MKTKKPAAPVVRRRRIPSDLPPADVEVEADEVDADLPADLGEMEIAEKLGLFHERFGDKDYKVRVELFNREDNEFEMVDTIKLDGFDPFSSLKKYGGGRYRLSLLDDGGKYVKGGRMEVRIAKVAADAAAAPAAAPDNGMTAVVAMLQAQNAQNVEIIKAALGRPTPEAKGPSLTELVQVLAGIKNLSPKEVDGMGGIKGTLELMKLVKEIMPAPAEPSEGGVMDEVTKAVELFGKIQPAIAARRGQSAAPRAAQPGGATVMPPGVVVNPVSPEPEPESPMKPVIDKAQSYVPQLVAWASRGKDVEDAADFVLEEVENEIVPLIVKHYRPGGITLNADLIFSQLIQKAQDPAQVAAIFETVPELASHQAWFERVIAQAVIFATTANDDAPVSQNDGEVHES